jgi:glycosyltransferase involved in cell wall biosynthesis
MKAHKKIYILYTEVMPYVAAVWNVLTLNHQCELVVVHWDKNKLTPYSFESKSIAIFARSEETLETLIHRLYSFKPDVLFVSGRMDKDYLSVSRIAKRKDIPVVMGSDKQWKGTVRDYIAVMLRIFLYRPYFTHAWIPGEKQYEYVRRVGFKNGNILSNLYTGNIELFNSFYLRRDDQLIKQDILFAGRLDRVKGILPLIKVLSELRKSEIFKGRLWILGNGPLKDDLPAHEWITHNGFTNQIEMGKIIRNVGIFCLPSIDEPWGVVLHEMAAAGIPICCSEACGAATLFVKHGFNGRIFKTGDWCDLKSNLECLIKLSLEDQNKWGERSHQLAQLITPEKSAHNLLSIWGEPESE